MDEPSGRDDELTALAMQVRVRVIEANKLVIAELTGIWDELNKLASGRPELRKTCTQIADDIARLEKLDLAFDTEWLAEAKRARP